MTEENFPATFQAEVQMLEEEGLRRSLVVKGPGLGVNFSSNDYLGLSNYPAVVEAACEAARRFGTGGTSSRLLAGTLDLHEDLEDRLARFFSKEAALVFSSGYHANTGVIPVVAGAGDVLFVDRLCHASIWDGVKLSNARFFSFRHNDPSDLETLLMRTRRNHRRAIIITEGVFSMDGDFPPLKEITDLAERWGALMYVDEAHGIGVFGPEGRGVAAMEGLLPKIDIFVGTLSKSLGSQGGFVAVDRSLRNLLISRSRAFIYTTALSPASCAAARAALDLLPELTERRRLILDFAQDLRENLAAMGYSTPQSHSQIVPVLTGELEPTRRLSEHLLSQGFFVPSIRPPTVPKGEGRVRLSISFEAVREGTERLLQAFAAHKGERIVQTR